MENGTLPNHSASTSCQDYDYRRRERHNSYSAHSNYSKLVVVVISLLSFQLLVTYSNAMAIHTTKIEDVQGNTNTAASLQQQQQNSYNQYNENNRQHGQSQNLSLIYSDEYIAVYSSSGSDLHPDFLQVKDADSNKAWSFETVSKMWKYIIGTYNLNPANADISDSRLYISLLDGNTIEIQTLTSGTGSGSGSGSNQGENSEAPRGIGSVIVSSFKCEDLSLANAINANNLIPVPEDSQKCDFASLAKGIVKMVWNLASLSPFDDQSETETETETETEELTKLFNTNSNINTESESDAEAETNAKNWGIWDIILYDVYMGINETDLAQSFKAQETNTITNFPKSGSHLLRDWYMPIYEEFGGTEVITSFFNILPLYTMLGGSPGIRNGKGMNVGEYAYLWSGASGMDLRGLAKSAFGWTVEYMAQFQEAQENFPYLNFSDVASAMAESVEMLSMSPSTQLKQSIGDEKENSTFCDNNGLFYLERFMSPTVSKWACTQLLDKSKSSLFIQLFAIVAIIPIVVFFIVVIALCSNTKFTCVRRKFCRLPMNDEDDDVISV